MRDIVQTRSRVTRRSRRLTRQLVAHVLYDPAQRTRRHPPYCSHEFTRSPAVTATGSSMGSCEPVLFGFAFLLYSPICLIPTRYFSSFSLRYAVPPRHHPPGFQSCQPMMLFTIRGSRPMLISPHASTPAAGCCDVRREGSSSPTPH